MSVTMPPEPRDAPDATITRAPSRRGLWIAITLGIVLLGAGVWLVVAELPRFLTTPETGTPAVSATSHAETRKILATLFYVSQDGMELVPASRDVPYGATPDEQARRILEAQVQAPPDGFASAIPVGTTVRSVFLGPRGEAYVDLGGTIVSGHSGGSVDEALTVYAIVNALCTNMRDVTAVQILVDGKEVDTLAGHLDLREPLAKSLEWVRKGQ